jgi:Protein of unknown function (DUF3137)
LSDLKSSFVDYEEAIWAELWKAMGGVYLNREGWRQDKLLVEHGDWIITLDFHSHGGYRTNAIYTRFRAAFDNPEDFHFKVVPQGALNTVGKLLGLQDVETGDPEFDKAFIVKSNDEARVKEVLDDPVLRQFLREESESFVGLVSVGGDRRNEYPDGVDEVLMEIPGKVVDTDQLKRLYMTFSRTLAGLCEAGAAYETRGV